MNLYNKLGKVALGSRLRRLTEAITEDAAKIYKLYQIDLQPKWFPVFYVLSEAEAKTVTAIAKEIGHSHPSVSKIIAEMAKKGVIQEQKDPSDGRRNLVNLTEKGKAITTQIKDQYQDVGKALEEISSQANNDLWQAIAEWEFLLEQKSLLIRVKEQQKLRESQNINIVDYEPQYKQAFKELNEQWISTYFQMEEADYRALDNPESYILQKGGCILVALYKGAPMGVCALIKMDEPDYNYELAKMAVSPKVQGKNVGLLLAQAAIAKAKALGAKSIYLESNTILKPAINLYHKLGFKKVTGHVSPYARCNIQMALYL